MTSTMAHSQQLLPQNADDTMEISSDAGGPLEDDTLIDIDLDLEAHDDVADEQMDEELEGQEDDLMEDEHRDDLDLEEDMQDCQEYHDLDQDEELQDAADQDDTIVDDTTQAEQHLLSDVLIDVAAHEDVVDPEEHEKILKRSEGPAGPSTEALEAPLHDSPQGESHHESAEDNDQLATFPQDHGDEPTSQADAVEASAVDNLDVPSSTDIPAILESSHNLSVSIEWDSNFYYPFTDSNSILSLVDQSDVATQPLPQLLSALRSRIQDYIFDTSELQIHFQQLALTVREVSNHTHMDEHSGIGADTLQNYATPDSCSLVDLNDIYLSLCMNDGIDDIQPLHVVLSEHAPFSARLQALHEALENGKGLQHVIHEVNEEDESYAKDEDGAEEEEASKEDAAEYEDQDAHYAQEEDVQRAQANDVQNEQEYDVQHGQEDAGPHNQEDDVHHEQEDEINDQYALDEHDHDADELEALQKELAAQEQEQEEYQESVHEVQASASREERVGGDEPHPPVSELRAETEESTVQPEEEDIIDYSDEELQGVSADALQSDHVETGEYQEEAHSEHFETTDDPVEESFDGTAGAVAPEQYEDDLEQLDFGDTSEYFDASAEAGPDEPFEIETAEAVIDNTAVEDATDSAALLEVPAPRLSRKRSFSQHDAHAEADPIDQKKVKPS